MCIRFAYPFSTYREGILFQHHINSVSQLVVCPYDGFRPTVVALLITPQDGIVLLHSVKAGHGQWGLLQGGIKKRESLLKALEREAEEELPGIELILPGVRLCGDCINEMPFERSRDAADKWMCVVVAPIRTLPAGYNPEEVDDICEVRSAAQLMPLLQKMRSKKRDIVCSAIETARHLGALNWTAAPIPIAA